MMYEIENGIGCIVLSKTFEYIKLYNHVNFLPSLAYGSGTLTILENTMNNMEYFVYEKLNN